MNALKVNKVVLRVTLLLEAGYLVSSSTLKNLTNMKLFLFYRLKSHIKRYSLLRSILLLYKEYTTKRKMLNSSKKKRNMLNEKFYDLLKLIIEPSLI